MDYLTETNRITRLYASLGLEDELAPEDIKRIFEPFYTKKSMLRSGTGLGMTVIWATVKDHSGYIDVSSREGTGSCFEVKGIVA